MSHLSNEITVKVQSRYLEDRFPDDEENFAFAYRITIINDSAEPVTLRNRYWLITNGDGNKSEVSGSGVVGEQPTIEPGKHYQYTSGAVLETPVGTMQGHYEFERQNGEMFEVPIPVFSLAVPNLIN